MGGRAGFPGEADFSDRSTEIFESDWSDASERE